MESGNLLKQNKNIGESPYFQQITEEESVQNTMTTDSNFANTLSVREKEYLKLINEKMKILEEFDKQESVIKAKRQELEQSLSQSTQKQNMNMIINNNNINSNNEKLQQGEIFSNNSMKNSQLQNLQDDFNQKQQSIHQRHSSPRNPLKEVEECTFQPKINPNAAKLSQRQPFNDENYMVNYLYGDALQRQEKTQIKLVQESINQQMEMNKSKISMKSQKIVIKKIEEALHSLLDSLQDQENEEFISFENLGLFFEKLGLFKALKFRRDENETSLHLGDRAKINMDRLQQEMIFHEQIWRILSISSDNENFVLKKLVFDIVMILLEKKLLVNQAINLFKEALSAKLMKSKEEIDELLNNLVNQDENEEQQQPSTAWSLEKLILEFRVLLEDKTSLMEWYSAKNNSILEQLMDQQNTNTQLSFKPQINEKSRLIDSSVGEGYFMKVIQRNSNEKTDSKFLKNRYDMLFEHSKYLKDKQVEEQQKFEQIELQKCTFHPQINNKSARMQSPQQKSNFQDQQQVLRDYLSDNENQYQIDQKNVLKRPQQSQQHQQQPNQKNQIVEKEQEEDSALPRYEKLYKQYQKKNKQLEEAKEKIDRQRIQSEIQECTFVPKTRKAIIIDKSNQMTNVKGVKQTIDRMNKAREEKQEKNSYWDKKTQQWMNHKTMKTTNQQPFQLQTDERCKKDRGEFLGNIDVNFSKGKKGRIVIYRDDDPEQLADNFSKIYSLSEEMKFTLQEMLAQYMKKLIDDQEKLIGGANAEQKIDQQQDDLEQINNDNEKIQQQLQKQQDEKNENQEFENIEEQNNNN